MAGWCKIKNAASYAGVSERTIEDWIKQGLKVSHLPSGHRLIKYEWIDEYLEKYANSSNRIDEMADKIMAGMKK